jgi:Amt family ammonium transporter
MKLRLPDDVLETGDLGAHDEEAYPDETLLGERTDLATVGAAAEETAPTTEPSG